MSWFSTITDPITGVSSNWQNPATAAQTYLDKIPEYANQYYQPYIDQGNSSRDILSKQYGQMSQNPADYYNSLYQTYEPSDYYKYNSDQMQKNMTNTAASGGYAGTENDVYNQAQQQNALLNQDWNSYLNSLLGIQGTGLQGEQGFYNTGYNASTGAANMMNQYALTSSGLAYNGVNQQNAYNQAKTEALNKAITSGAKAGMMA